jgi:AcrR family transcriptional regulator
MGKNEDRTREKILLSALTLFSERGISKTSVNEVAYRAGVSRVTVYRYFPEKEHLVYEAFLHVEQLFQNALADLNQGPEADCESVLGQIGEGLRALPRGDVFARFDELKRVYPDLYTSIQEVRRVTLTGIFEHLFALAERQGLLRPEVNRSVFQAVFWELIGNFFDNPRFRSLELSDAELYQTVTDILLHGFLRSRSTVNATGD